MATTKEISMTLGRTLSDGNYGSIKVEVSETMLLNRSDDPATEYKKLTKRLGARFRRAKEHALTTVNRG